MAQRLNWAKANFAKKPKLSISDEQEFFDRDHAARWLERAEKREARRKKSKQSSPRRNKAPLLRQRLSSGRLRIRLSHGSESGD